MTILEAAPPSEGRLTVVLTVLDADGGLVAVDLDISAAEWHAAAPLTLWQRYLGHAVGCLQGRLSLN